MIKELKWQWLSAVLFVAACGAAGFIGEGWAEGVPVRQVKLIRVSAKRFVFVPGQLTLKKGETVDIALTTEDVPMGFSVPDLNSRTDILPGAVAHLRLTPEKTGRFPFLCDIFCGSGHEDMNGVIDVVD